MGHGLGLYLRQSKHKTIRKMEIIFVLFVIAIIAIIVKVFRSKPDDAQRSSESLPDGLAMARQRAEQQGDTEAVQAIDNGTYKELMEKRAAERITTLPPGVEIYQYSIAGINYRKGITAYLGRSTGYIKPEPTNRHDPNAIAVYADDGHHLGYIPATDTYEVHSLRLRFPIPVAVYIEECYDADDRRFYVGEVSFHVQTKKPAKWLPAVTNR